jgi:hypothetical protein
MKWLRNILIFAPLLVAGIAHAQSLGTGVDPVQYIVAPETPGPHQSVSITVQGVGTFLGDATVTWSVNGAIAKQGTGASDFSFTTGNLGQQTTIKLTIDSATQGTITHLFTFIPSTIDLVWEADTSVPPLYRGHALYTPGSTLKVVAFPTVIVGGKKVAAESLSYQWSINDNPVPASSGTGKSTLSFIGDQLNDGESVAVDVYFGSLKVGRGELTIPAAQPQILFYNKDALRGIVWDQALPSAIALNATEITIFAQPYFFANNGSWSWNWTMQGSPVTGPDTDKGLLTLRQTGAGQGNADLTASIQNLSGTQLVQSAQAALQIVFGQKASGISTFFGI